MPYENFYNNFRVTNIVNGNSILDKVYKNLVFDHANMNDHYHHYSNTASLIDFHQHSLSIGLKQLRHF